MVSSPPSVVSLSPSEEKLAECTLSSQLVFDGVLLKVHRDLVALPDGSESVREFVRHPGAVIVIAVTDSGSIVVERQFRYPLGRVFIELPAGKLDGNEDPEACARRELMEETGYVASAWRYLGVIHPCIGYADERIEIFLASGLTHVGQKLDPGEFLEVMELPLDVLLEKVKLGEMTDGKSVAALFWGEKALLSGW